MLSDTDIKEIIRISEKTVRQNCSIFNGEINTKELPHAIASAIAEAILKYDELR